MAVNVLGRAYIEVHADTKPFGRELKESVTAITALAEKEAAASGGAMGRKLSSGVEAGFAKSAPATARTISRAFDRELSRVAGRSGGVFGRLLDRSRGSILRTATKLGGEAGGNFARSLGQVGSEALKTAGGLASSIGASIGNVGSASPLAPAVALGIPALIGAVIALSSVLGPLLNVVGLIPGALGLVAASIVPVVVGFQGFGDAISAIMSGDLDKINEALKTLSPSAAKVAQEFGKILPIFRDIKKSTQEALFENLVTILPRVTEAISPILKLGFAKVSSSFGNFFKNILLLAEDKQVQDFFTNMFDLASFTFDTLGGPFKLLMSALAGVGNASIPTLKELINGIAAGIISFSSFLQGVVEDGSFQRFLNGFIEALNALMALGKAGANLIDSLLGNPEVQASAKEFFNFLLEMVNGLADFFRSDVGTDAIQGMIDAAGGFALLLSGIIVIVGTIFAAFEQVAKLVREIVRLMVEAGLIEGIQRGIRRIGPNRNVGGSPTGHADGGIFNSEHIARIAEGGKREVVIPLTNQRRAMELADRSGLTSMVNNNDVAVNVYIGDEQIAARIDKRVAAGIKGLTSAMRYGPRPVGIGG